ncbi:Blue-pigment (indigoidine) synthetase [Vibrio nigripulchritudo SOn1]|uniref:Blue-pigment (Indigoidine) synthetase n=1 Tax=Vibrio nigripulchritudo SOn1 TaxID=1238450 RepID=A0AAV2VI04_9VIBR|nr:amino acid adenylation domain-containing protein [Vibrio nigripulchritudo]CCO44267.1 Blue-pigment (indigoidine) synthetase [Vibrio nigripulchritudo SOn1]
MNTAIPKSVPNTNLIEDDNLTSCDPCLLSMLESHALTHPEDIAVQDLTASHTYGEFFHQVVKNANDLSSAIDDQVSRIGLYFSPSADMVLGAWSILASNRAYLPLALDYPTERLRYMVEDSGIQVVLTSEHLKEQLTSIVTEGIKIVTLEELNNLPTSSKTNGNTDVSSERLAYVIYTSGSSGKPKGVMVTYQNISNQIAFMKNQFGFDRSDRIIQKTPSSFDAAQWEILAPAYGSRLIVGPEGCYKDPDAMLETIIDEEITVLQCVPTLLQALVDHPLFPDCESLNQVFSGGEILTRNLAKQFFNKMPDASLTNLYGPTECTVNASTFTLSQSSINTYPDAISIGKPVANTMYHVLRENGEPALVNEIGELHISGIQVSNGYHNRPELTAEKFIKNPKAFLPGHEILYKTGDLVKQDNDGNTHFIGRADSQIKLRGYRVELDEIRLAIENHNWVKTAAVVVKDDARTGHQNLVACVELDETQAALMDQGNHDSHHQSKSNKFQVKAQLSNSGSLSLEGRKPEHIINLSGKTASKEQRARAFGRKTYRFFESDTRISKDILLSLLEHQPPAPCSMGNQGRISLENFGVLLRNFGQFLSEERLLPKHAYASPGALYATQMYFELSGMEGLQPGIYYYHPVEHCLIHIRALPEDCAPCFNIHFIGKRSAIEHVYKNNVLEVLEMETGHMLGLFDELLPEHAHSVSQNLSVSRDTLPEWYEGERSDYYLGSYRIENHTPSTTSDAVQILVQAHENKVEGLPAGLYRYRDGDLDFMTNRVIEKSDVIAINQKVYERSSFGISMVCNSEDKDSHYVHLGRALHRFQSNHQLLGMMSSGYSSKSGNDLPSALKIRSIVSEFNLPVESFYFCIGGAVSQEQYQSEGMYEDSVHMKGPAEMLKEELEQQLPNYMIPNKVLVLNNLPQTVNGKVDLAALNQLDALKSLDINREMVPLCTEAEKKIGDIWCRVMKWESVSAQDNFFESGGNSLTAVALVNRINGSFAIKMPLQVLFEKPTIADLAKWVEENGNKQHENARFIRLSKGSKDPVFCWPGLGGYPLSLRSLADGLFTDQSLIGIQALGINKDEVPLASVKEMAAEDIKQIKALQPNGPYTLWGYSFGARVAFETAAQLEAMGDEVKALYLLAPGAPVTQMEREKAYSHEARFDNPVFLAILFSVFAHRIEGKLLDRCLQLCRTEDDFVSFICQRFTELEESLVKRIIRVVAMTYGFSYQFDELANRKLNTPITILKAQGDHYSFLENSPPFSQHPPKIIELNVDHYQVLKEAGIQELKQLLQNEHDLEDALTA